MAGGVMGGGEDEPMAEMNLIPLIDISLTLLIILMVTSAFIRQPGVALRLPETATREGKPETPKDLTVAIARDGKLFVNGKLENDAGMRILLARFARSGGKEGRVLIKGDRDVAYSQVMRVMDLVRQAGLVRVVLPTDPTPNKTAKGTAAP